MSRRDVVEARLGISEPTLHRIETGKVPVTGANVRALCWLYGADQSITDALADLALGTSQQEWWDASPVIPEWFKLYVGLEASASRMFGYDGEVVPGELQTPEYARAVFGAEQPVDSEIAERHTISVYDAAYAAAADEGGHRLISCDERDLVSKDLAALPEDANKEGPR